MLKVPSYAPYSLLLNNAEAFPTLLALSLLLQTITAERRQLGEKEEEKQNETSKQQTFSAGGAPSLSSLFWLLSLVLPEYTLLGDTNMMKGCFVSKVAFMVCLPFHSFFTYSSLLHPFTLKAKGRTVPSKVTHE